jgi:hypothetical protein
VKNYLLGRVAKVTYVVEVALVDGCSRVRLGAELQGGLGAALRRAAVGLLLGAAGQSLLVVAVVEP